MSTMEDDAINVVILVMVKLMALFIIHTSIYFFNLYILIYLEIPSQEQAVLMQTEEDQIHWQMIRHNTFIIFTFLWLSI